MDAGERRFRVAVALTGLAALALRAAHLAALAGAEVASVTVQDAGFYHEQAQRLLGRLPPLPDAGAPFMNVGYGWFLATVYALAGPRPIAALLLQVAAGAATVVLIALAARAWTGSRSAGVVAGLVTAFYAPAVFYDGLLLTPTPTNLLLAFAAWALSVPRARPAIAAGLAVSGAIVLRASAALLVPPLAGLAALGAGVLSARSPRRGAAFVVAALAVPCVVIVVNGLSHGEWVPVTANGGMNLWVGNHASATGYYVTAPFLGNRGADGEARAYLEEARRRSGETAMTMAASSRYWTDAALADVSAAPGRWARLLARKAALFASNTEIKTNVGIDFIAGLSPPLRTLPLRFGLLLGAGLAGIGLLYVSARRRAAALALTFVAAPLATCLVFFVSGEYRHPASLGLAIGAGGLVAAASEVRRRTLATAGLAGAVVAAASFVPIRGLRDEFHPYVDVRSYVRTLGVPGRDGAPPTRDALDRAERILARAPADPSRDLLLLDTRFWLAWRRAVYLADAREARLAIEAGQALAARDLRPGRPGYADGLLAYLRDVLAARAEDLATLPAVRSDPGLAREAAGLVARTRPL